MADIEEEFRLAWQLKENYCDKSGKEINAAKAAEIIHQIGVMYRKRSPDKISLIKSAGLFNAAIVRNPENILQIKCDLIEICQHILRQARAKNQNADLVKKGEQVKNSIHALRQEVETFLKHSVPKIQKNTKQEDIQEQNLNKVLAIQQLNKTIANNYKEMMADLSQFCEEIMGKPPCEYALAGMGSLAREEITPYSDFEHIILLCNDKNYKSYLEYFKWFSVIFHVVVLTVQETIIPSLNISSLNDKDSILSDWYYDAVTPRGISFDGMMPHACKFPLGRQQHTKNKQFNTELIKPVNEMLEYLSSDADLKNGYHLADILTKTCFVFGNEDVFKQFLNGAKNTRDSKSQTDIINEVNQQVKNDLNNFSTRFRLTDLNSQSKINIKQFIYRSTTIFISALARIHNISANSCFDIINEMAKNKKISKKAAGKLRFAIAIACETRLRVYMKNKSQCDTAVDLTQDSLDNFLDIVGVASTVNYFQIAYCLQCEVAKQLNFTKFHFYSDPQLVNVIIGLAFGIHNLVNFTKNPKKRFWDSSSFDFDTSIELLEKEIELDFCSASNQIFKKEISRNDFQVFRKNEMHLSTQSGLSEKRIEAIANYLFSVDILDEALDFYKHLLRIYERSPNGNGRDFNIARTNVQIGLCLKQLKQSAEALHYLNRALVIQQNIFPDAEKNWRVAATLNNIGACYVDLDNCDDALIYLNRALEIRRNTTLNFETDKSIAKILHSLGSCYAHLQNYDDALKNLNQALSINRSSILDDENDSEIADTLHTICTCHIRLLQNKSINIENDRDLTKLRKFSGYHVNVRNYNDVLTYLYQALKIKQNITINSEKDRSIAETLYEIGFCYSSLHNYEDALTNNVQALEIFQNTTLDAENDKDIAISLNRVGGCHMDLHHYDDALAYLKRALKIYQNITLNAENDENIALTFHKIGRCYKNLHEYEDALRYLNQAFEIEQKTTLNASNNMSFAITLYDIGCCYIELHNYDNALMYLNRALEINLTTTVNVETDSDIATILYDIGVCHTKLHNYSAALHYLKRAMNIEQNTTLSVENDKDIAATLYDISSCYINLHCYDDALIYLNRTLKIEENTSFNAKKDGGIVKILDKIVCCYTNLQRYDEALTYLTRTLDVYQNRTLDAEKDSDIATTLYEIGRCHSNLHHYGDALPYLNRALEIDQSTTLNLEKDSNIAATLYEIGSSHKELHNYNNALKHFNRALEIYQKTTLKTENDSNVATTLYSIGYCHIEMHYYNDALTYLNQALKIYQNETHNYYRNLAITQCCIGRCAIGLKQYDNSWNWLQKSLINLENAALYQDKDRHTACIFNYMGECLIGKQHFSEALTNLQRALKIYQSSTTCAEQQTSLARTFHNTGFCLMKLQEYANALDYLKHSVEIYENLPQNDHIASKIALVCTKIYECITKLG